MAGKTKLKAGCGIGLVFSAGFLCGVIAFFVLLIKVIPKSEGWKDSESKEFVANHLANQLSLTDEQRTKIRPIVDDALDKRWSVRKTYLLEDRVLVQAAFEEILPLLDEKQKAKATKMHENWWDGKKRLLMPEEDDGSDEPDGEGEEKTEEIPLPQPE